MRKSLVAAILRNWREAPRPLGILAIGFRVANKAGVIAHQFGPRITNDLREQRRFIIDHFQHQVLLPMAC